MKSPLLYIPILMPIVLSCCLLLQTGCAESSYDISLAEHSLNLGDELEAITLADAAESTSKNHKRKSALAALKAVIRAKKGDDSRAIEEIRTAVKYDSKNPEIRKMTAEAYYWLHDYARAYGEINRSLELDPENFEAYKRKIQILEKLKGVKKALKFSLSTLREHSLCAHSQKDINKLFLISANLLLKERENEKALKLYDDILKSEPENDAALLGKAAVYFKEGKTKQAKDYILKAKKANKRNADSYLLSALIYEKENSLVKMKEELEQALNLVSSNIGVNIAYGKVKLLENDLQEAKKYMQAALRSDESNPDALLLKAYIYLKEKRSEKAEKLIDKLRKEHENLPEVNIAAAEILLQKQRVSEAEKLLQKILTADPDFIPANIYLAKLALATKDFKKADIYLSKALALSPSNASALYYQACLYAAEKNEIKALESLKQAAESGFSGKDKLLKDYCWEPYLKNPDFIKISSKIK